MLRLTILIIACTLFVNVGYSQRKEMRKNGVTVEKDDFTGKKRKQLNLSTGKMSPLSESSIGLVKTTNGHSLYSFIYKDDWIFVESIMIKIDGEMFEFDSQRDRREVESGGYVSEKNWYDPTPEFIKALKNAKEISYRLVGSDYYTDFDIKPKKLNAIEEYFE